MELGWFQTRKAVKNYTDFYIIEQTAPKGVTIQLSRRPGHREEI